MRPGKPMLFGRRGPQRVLGLPGNPVSCLVTARVFLLPLIAKLLGREARSTTNLARTAVALEANGPRTHYMRAKLEAQPNAAMPLATPLASQDSSAAVAAGRGRLPDCPPSRRSSARRRSRRRGPAARFLSRIMPLQMTGAQLHLQNIPRTGSVHSRFVHARRGAA